MTRFLTEYLERNTFDFRPASRSPQQIINQLNKYLQRLKKIGQMNEASIRRYEERMRNVN